MGRYISVFGFLSAVLCTACMQNEEEPKAEEPKTDFTIFASETVGDHWVYESLSYQVAAGMDKRFSGSKSVTLTHVEKQLDGTVYDFLVRDSLKEVRKGAWGHVSGIKEHPLRVTRKGESVIGAGADFPFWSMHAKCQETPGRAEWDGQIVRLSVCTPDREIPREDWSFAVAVAEGIGKIYEDGHDGGGGGDSSGYRLVLQSFNGNAVPTGALVQVGTRGFEAARYSSQDPDPAVFAPFKTGDKWAYAYQHGGGLEPSLSGMKFMTAEVVNVSVDSSFFAFSIHDSLESRIEGLSPNISLIDTTYPMDLKKDSSGTAHVGPGKYSETPLYWGSETNTIFPDLKKRKVGEDSLWVLIIRPSPAAGFSFPVGTIYVQSIGIVYSGDCHCIGTMHPNQTIMSLVSFNSKPLNGDSLALAWLGK
ncbi:MAG: hypothetical protein JWO30_76 [Fibrobacteres bacterium]|nr:hypothetical protein [Fibrobacterota bacterium]